MKKAAVVFTFKSVERIIGVDGGTQSWRLHRSHIGTFDFVICTRNQSPDAEGPEQHRSAFLIGKVRDIVPSTEQEPGHPYQRYLIRMSEAALITDKPEFWQFGRWPLHIDTLEALGIDPERYDFKSLRDLMQEIRQTAASLGCCRWHFPLRLVALHLSVDGANAWTEQKRIWRRSSVSTRGRSKLLCGCNAAQRRPCNAKNEARPYGPKRGRRRRRFR